MHFIAQQIVSGIQTMTRAVMNATCQAFLEMIHGLWTRHGNAQGCRGRTRSRPFKGPRRTIESSVFKGRITKIGAQNVVLVLGGFAVTGNYDWIIRASIRIGLPAPTPSISHGRGRKPRPHTSPTGLANMNKNQGRFVACRATPTTNVVVVVIVIVVVIIRNIVCLGMRRNKPCS